MQWQSNGAEMTYKAATDNNQTEIVKAFRDAGAFVKDVHQLKNAFDILVAWRGELLAVEIKDGTLPPSHRKLSDGERHFHEELAFHGVKVHIVTSIEDVYKVLNLLYCERGKK